MYWALFYVSQILHFTIYIHKYIWLDLPKHARHMFVKRYSVHALPCFFRLFWLIYIEIHIHFPNVAVWNVSVDSGMLLAPIRSFRVCTSHQSERCYCSLVWEVFKFRELTRDSDRKMASSFSMRNIGSSVFLTCILPRFKRNAILLDRWKTPDYL